MVRFEIGENRGITKGCTRSTYSGGCEVVRLLFVPGEPRRYHAQRNSAKILLGLTFDARFAHWELLRTSNLFSCFAEWPQCVLRLSLIHI